MTATDGTRESGSDQDFQVPILLDNGVRHMPWLRSTKRWSWRRDR